MNTASDTLLERPAPRAPAHLKSRPVRGPRVRRSRDLVAGLSRRRRPHDQRQVHGVAPSSMSLTEAVPVPEPVEDHHETAIESPMPTVSQVPGQRLYSAVTLPIAVLVACVYIGVPLALFTHDFSNHRLLATLVASALVFAAAFGGVLRVLKTTTALAGRPSPDRQADRDKTQLRSAAFAIGPTEQGEHPWLVEA